MAWGTMSAAIREEAVQIPAGSVALMGELGIPEHAQGAVLFAHGSGSSRLSPRNRFVAQHLQEAGLATLLMDLLTKEEELAEAYTGHLRFDIRLLADRLAAATDWLTQDSRVAGLRIGYFGASTGAGAALVAATMRPQQVSAIVSRGGRPDLAADALAAVRAATLLIVGGDDDVVIHLNQQALARLGTPIKQLQILPGASHLFEEPGKLDEVARLAAGWFTQYTSAGQKKAMEEEY